MKKDLEALCQALDSLSAGVTAGWSGDQTFCEAWGWNCASVTRHDMAAVPARLAHDIRAANLDLLVQCAALFCTYPAAAANAALARVTLAKMSLALAVQMKGLGSML